MMITCTKCHGIGIVKYITVTIAEECDVCRGIGIVDDGKPMAPAKEPEKEAVIIEEINETI